jgi:hypothetical protein
MYSSANARRVARSAFPVRGSPFFFCSSLKAARVIGPARPSISPS